MPNNDKSSDRMTNSGEPMSAPPTTYYDGQRVRSPLNRPRTRKDSSPEMPKEPLWGGKPPIPIEHL
jgi:hypothetical protein